ncbi:MAG TPA: phage holin family protein, partial [Nitrospirales bacterium]|nr:phage holin family protein [Nitrospirales bacterium]
EMQLARHEILTEVAKARAAAAGIALAIGIGAVGALMLILTFVHGLHALGLPMWASYGLVAAVLLGAAGFFFGRARRAAHNIHLVPTKTAQTVKENVTWLKDRVTSPRT